MKTEGRKRSKNHEKWVIWRTRDFLSHLDDYPSDSQFTERIRSSAPRIRPGRFDKDNGCISEVIRRTPLISPKVTEYLKTNIILRCNLGNDMGVLCIPNPLDLLHQAHRKSKEIEGKTQI